MATPNPVEVKVVQQFRERGAMVYDLDWNAAAGAVAGRALDGEALAKALRDVRAI